VEQCVGQARRRTFTLLEVKKGGSMKIAGFMLLVAGWVIVLAALVLLVAMTPRSWFVLAGLGIEGLGLVLVIRAHIVLRGEKG
jgi:hypothetical protein